MKSGRHCLVEGLESRRLLSAVFANGNDNDIVRDAAGAEHLAFRDVTPGANNALMYATRPSGGAWSAPTPIDLGAGPNGVRGDADDTSVGEYVSINVDSNNRPGAAYYDATNGDLKYAKFDGTAWSVQTVDAQHTVGYYPSLVFNNSNRPIICYYKKTGGDLRVAAFNGSQWGISTVDSGLATVGGVSVNQDVGRHTSLAIQESTGRWGVSYENASDGYFRYARQTSSGFAVSDVHDTAIGGGYTSLAFDPDGDVPTFTFYDADNANLMIARAANADGTGAWNRSTIAGLQNQSGKYTNLWYRPDGSGQHRARVTYYNETERSIYLLDENSTPGSFGTPSLVFSGGGFEHEAVAESAADVTYTWVKYYADGSTDLFVNGTATGKSWARSTSGAVGARAYHAAAVFTDPADQTSKMWVLGGSYSTILGSFYRGDVLKSADGVTWTQATSAAAFGPRREMAALPFTDPADGKAKLWVLGGYNSAAVSDTVYSSEDGSTWTRAAIDADNLPPVYRHAAAVFPDPANNDAPTMWVIGGRSAGGAVSDDIYKSVDGVNWTLANGAAAFGPRYASTLIRHEGKLWLIGGADAAHASRRDVWSSTDGVTWTAVAGTAAGAQFDPTMPATAGMPGVSYDGKLWVLTGPRSWFSYDGIGWTPVDNAAMDARGGHASVAYADKMWVLAGAETYSNATKADAHYAS